jgi:hypothetical protein
MYEFADHFAMATIIQQESQSSDPMWSIFAGVAVSFLSAVLVYSARQIWEKKKLHRALLTEVEEMEGIEICANQMERIDSPPTRQLSADDVPAEDAISTTVYQNTASRIGLLGGRWRGDELKGVVRFYSKALRYKSIIRSVNELGRITPEEESEKDNGEETIPVSDNDQEDLYNKIGKLSDVRDEIIRSESFAVEYPEELELGSSRKN